MRNYAICLEVFVEISEKELEGLKDKPLNHVLRFSNNVEGEEDYYIPMEFRLASNQEENLRIEQNPDNVYFGEAENVSFLINQEVYDILKERGSYGQRFYHGGKLIVHVKDR